MDDIVKSLKDTGPATLIIIAALMKFGFVGVGRETPDFLRPAPVTPGSGQ